MLRALTHKVSSRISECELTFVERTPIDYQLATCQHDEYESLLTRIGVSVTSLFENDDYPDACFVEDTAIVVDELAVICSMGVFSRRGETPLIARELSNYRDLTHISLPATIEGGDVLRVGRQILAGQSKRTNIDGIRALKRIFEPIGYQVSPVTTKGGLHLKSGCTAIDDETLFVNPESIDIDCLKGFKLLRTPREEPASANVLRVGETVCLQSTFPRAIDLIGRVVKRVETIDMSELRKAEAGLTCSSIIFET
ncbi:MAG TPA: arginine deiminase family protein [Pyrinomonadaceae bacterium]|nr:arginine deiminase family protein [Pyrinomonadaceae bacterium]